MNRQSAQVLAFFALVLPIVLLPVAAYAVDATVIASRAASLQAATAQAAETGSQQLNVAAFRSSGALTVDAAAALLVAERALADEEPGASVDSCVATGATVTVVTSEPVTLPFSIFVRTITLHARVTARLVPGYDNRTT
jgi:Flp pilus assembly protein TadG